MADRHKTHNGRDRDGRFRVRQADIDDVMEDPDGVDVVRDDVRLGGAVADVGPRAGQSGEHVEELVIQNREDVDRVTGHVAKSRRTGRARRR